jgi:hypothetical protein
MEKETPKHTPEPWELNKTTDGLSITSKNGVIVHCYSVSISDYNHDIPKANAARIVECVNAMAGIDDPKKWVEEMKDENKLLKRVLKSTDDSITCINWEGEEPIRLKLEAENEKLKKALGRIYTMDTSFEKYINAIVELKQIAGDAIK